MEWTETDSRGEWRALVDPKPANYDEECMTRRREWVIRLDWPGGSWTSPEGHGIFTTEGDTGIGALGALAAFLGAWDEAQRYPGSENRDLFPKECEPFLEVVEEFATATMMYEDDPANG